MAVIPSGATGGGGVLPVGLLVGQALIWDGTKWTSGNSATANNFAAMDGFTTGRWYAGSSTTVDGELAGSHVSVVASNASRIRGFVAFQFGNFTQGASLVGLKARGTQAAPLIVQTNDAVLRMDAESWDGAAWQQGATITALVDGAPAAGSVPVGWHFTTGTSAATQVIRLDIPSTGGVFATESLYAGATAANAEQNGSVVSLSAGPSIRRGHIAYQYSADALGGRFVGLKARGAEGAPVVVQNGDQVALLVGGGWDGADFSGSSRVAIEVDGAVVPGTVPMRVAFYTGSGALPTLRGSISSAGVWNIQGVNAGVLSADAAGNITGRAPVDQLEWAALDTGNTNATRYLRILNNVNSVLAAPGAGGRRTMARPGYIIGMAARFDGGALAAANTTWNVEINGVASAASLTVNATNQQGVVSGLAVPFSALDYFAVTEVCSVADATTSRPVVEVLVAYV